MAGCTNTPSPTSIVQPTDCRARIEAANLADVATIDAVDECRFTAAGAQAAREVLAAAGSRDRLWAAVWVYSSAAADPAPLVAMLQNGDASVRAMAAATVVRLGDRAGLAVLSNALSSDEYLAGALPPMTVGQFAEFSLSRTVSGAGMPGRPAKEADEPAVAAAWIDWLGMNGAALSYDHSKGEWLLP